MMLQSASPGEEMSENGHKQFWGPGVLLALAFLVSFSPLRRAGLDVHVRDAYRVVPLRVVGFWGLLGAAAIWLLIIAVRFNRRRS
jgi:hypothetical protein